MANFKYFAECNGVTVDLMSIRHDGHVATTAKHFSGTCPMPLSDDTINDWIELSRRDDCLDRLVPSDVRQMLGEIVRLQNALEFYANPENYFAVAIIGDSPCGAFADDVSDTDEPMGWRHGKHARIALGWEAETVEPETVE